MSHIAHTPKTKDQYTDPAEKMLYDYFANELGWGESLHARATFELLIDVRNFSKGKTILDAGAGHKRFEPFFNNATYLTVEHPAGIEMKQMEGIAYDFIAELDGEIFTSEESIDAIYSHSALEHIERPEKFFANAIRILKPGGRLFIHCPFMYLEHETPYDFNRFTRYGIQSRLEEAGFTILKLMPSSNAFYGTSAFVLHAIQHDGNARGFQVNNYTLPDGNKIPLMELLGNIIGILNNMFDDAIYDNCSPIGSVVRSRKARAQSDLIGYSKVFPLN